MINNENVNYEELNTPTHYVKFISGLTGIPLRQQPLETSEVVEDLMFSSKITMLREWADGRGEWAYVQTENTKTKGYVRTDYLTPTIPYTNKFLPKSKVDIQNMSPLAKALMPEWYDTDEPFYHRENGECWISVVLPYT